MLLLFFEVDAAAIITISGPLPEGAGGCGGPFPKFVVLPSMCVDRDIPAVIVGGGAGDPPTADAGAVRVCPVPAGPVVATRRAAVSSELPYPEFALLSTSCDIIIV